MARSLNKVPHGYCQCGCGQKTKVAKRNRYDIGHVKGKPVDYIHGHQGRGERNTNWRGGRAVIGGYVKILAPSHPNAAASGYVREHILVASRAMGKPVPRGCPVHHVNGIKTDNRPSNLVVCEDTAYHHLLHRRQAALAGCGNPNWVKCWICGEWGDPTMGTLTVEQRRAYHPPCRREYRKQQRRAA